MTYGLLSALMKRVVVGDASWPIFPVLMISQARRKAHTCWTIVGTVGGDVGILVTMCI